MGTINNEKICDIITDITLLNQCDLHKRKWKYPLMAKFWFR